MPLSINVGLSRKASKNYQSTGVSINVMAELDSTLLTKPEQLAQQIAGLYAQAETAIDRQVKAYAAATTPASETFPQTPERTNGNVERYRRIGTHGYDQHHHDNGSRHTVSMTPSQRRVIHAIAERAGLDATQEAHDIFGVVLDDLTLKQASELISAMKYQTPANNGTSRR